MGTAICLLLVCGQIETEIPRQSGFTVADLQLNPVHRMRGDAFFGQTGEMITFPIRPYLHIARKLQDMPEENRVEKLSEWARIESLSTPVKILCYMLVEKADGTPLRPPIPGGMTFVLRGEPDSFPDRPFLYFRGVPFFIVSGIFLMGPIESATDYLKRSLSVGRWREVKFEAMGDKELAEVAEAFVDRYKGRAIRPSQFRSTIMRQVGPRTDSVPKKQ